MAEPSYVAVDELKRRKAKAVYVLYSPDAISVGVAH